MNSADLLMLLLDARTFNRERGISGLLLRDASGGLRALAGDRPCARRMLAFPEGRADE